MIELIGGPDRDRTDDLFHAMECFKSQIIERHRTYESVQSAKTGTIGDILLPKCCQICNQWATGLIVWDQPKFLDWPRRNCAAGCCISACVGAAVREFTASFFFEFNPLKKGLGV